MPAFQEAYTDEQRWLIVNYVRTLALPTDQPRPNHTKNETNN
jgi:mono/diheme cytochrome c family protein